MNNLDDFFNVSSLSNQFKNNIASADSSEDEEFNPKRKSEFCRQYSLRSKSAYFEDPVDKIQPVKKQRLETAAKKLKPTPYFFQLKTSDGKIVGREKEAKEIVAMLQQPLGGMRPLLLGPHGIGKRSIVEKVAELYHSGLKGSPWKERGIYCLSCRDLIAEHIAEDPCEEIVEHIKELIDKHFTKKEPPILYLRDIETLMSMPQLAEYVKTVFKSTFPMIASIAENVNDEKVSQLISTLSDYNFYRIELKESPLEDVQVIVQNHLKLHGNKSIKYTKESINLAVRLSANHIKSRPMPVKAINAIQECGSALLMDQYLSGNEATVNIDQKEVAAFFSSKTGIPAEDLLDITIFNEQRFINRLKENIVGQEYAINIIAKQVASWKMGLLSPNQPWGAFLFVGPSGVGKTELAKQIAKQLFRNEADILILDGSEYRESHTASNLVGAPKGYEGHDSGGMLTGPL